MRVFVSAALIILALLVIAGCGGGGHSNPITTGSLAGFIYADSGGAGMVASATARADRAPIPGATITVSGQDISAVTDDAGHFQLDGIYTGTRQFYVERDGYTRSTFSMNIGEGTNTVPSSVDPLAPASLKWMVMVYMAADNNLDTDGFADQDMNEMEAAPNSPDVMTLVLSDRYGANNTRLYQIQHDTDTVHITSPVIYNPGELDTGLASTLGWFTNYCQTDPGLPRAEHYMLVIWDHGSGWDTYYDRSFNIRAIGEDDTSNSVMRIVDIPPVLTQPYPIDILATDACLMAMLEVAYEWRACGDYFIGSEEETPGDGFNYTSVLSLINSDTGLQMTPGELTNGITAAVYTVWHNDYPSGPYVLRLSAIDLRRLDPLASALDTLSVRLIAVGRNYTTQLADIYGSVEHSYYGDYRADLYDYADLLGARIGDSTLRSAASQLKTSVNSAVTANFSTSTKAHGISIYLPTKTAYTRSLPGIPPPSQTYPGLQLSADTHWNEWLAGQP